MLSIQNSLNRIRLIQDLNVKKHLTLSSMVSKCVRRTCGLVPTTVKWLRSIYQVIESQLDAIDLHIIMSSVLKELLCSEEFISWQRDIIKIRKYILYIMYTIHKYAYILYVRGVCTCVWENWILSKQTTQFFRWAKRLEQTLH